MDKAKQTELSKLQGETIKFIRDWKPTVEDKKDPITKLKEYTKEVVRLCEVSRSLPKVCIGCGSLETDKIDDKYLACCPDNNYIPLRDYLKDSRYIKYTKFKR